MSKSYEVSEVKLRDRKVIKSILSIKSKVIILGEKNNVYRRNLNLWSNQYLQMPYKCSGVKKYNILWYVEV